jgi:hypothetical protein
MKQFIYGATVVAAFVCGAAYPVFAESLPRSGLFFYSSQCYQANGGDAGGGYFKLTRTATGDKAVVGWSGEGPMEAITATNACVTTQGSKNVSAITYTVTFPGDAKGRAFTGAISTTEMHIKGVDGKYYTIPRQKLIYKPGVCR